MMSRPRTTRVAERLLDPVAGQEPRPLPAQAVTRAPLPDLPGIITAGQVYETACHIAANQRPDGLIPWCTGLHADPWDHVEAAMALSVERPARRGAARVRVERERSSAGRHLADGDRRRRRARRQRRQQPVRLPRRRHLARVAADRRPSLRRDDVAYRPFGDRVRPRPPAAGRCDVVVAQPVRRRRSETRCSPAAPAWCCPWAARSPSPTCSMTRSRTGSCPPHGWHTPWRCTRAPSRTRAATRWTGTTRSSAARCAGRRPAACSTAAGPSSWCRDAASAASPTGRG